MTDKFNVCSKAGKANPLTGGKQMPKEHVHMPFEFYENYGCLSVLRIMKHLT